MQFRHINSDEIILELAQVISEVYLRGLNGKVIIFVSSKYDKIPLERRETDAVLLPKETSKYECEKHPQLDEVLSILDQDFDFVVWLGKSVPAMEEEDVIRRSAHELRHIYQHKKYPLPVAKERLIDVALSIYDLPFNSIPATDKDAIDFENMVMGVPPKYNCKWINEIESTFKGNRNNIRWIRKEIQKFGESTVFPATIDIGKETEKGLVAKDDVEFFNYLYNKCFSRE